MAFYHGYEIKCPRQDCETMCKLVPFADSYAVTCPEHGLYLFDGEGLPSGATEADEQSR